MNTTTLLDLNQTAAAAATKALTAPDQLAVESVKLEAFTAAAHDRADYPTWESFFTSNLRNYTQWQKTPSPATAAATSAANTTAVTAKAAAANKTQVAASGANS